MTAFANNRLLKYPGWPGNVTLSLREWEKLTEFPKVPMGEGLLGGDRGLPAIDLSPAHPEYVKNWRHENNQSVAKTAEYFGLTDVQVLEACR